MKRRERAAVGRKSRRAARVFFQGFPAPDLSRAVDIPPSKAMEHARMAQIRRDRWFRGGHRYPSRDFRPTAARSRRLLDTSDGEAFGFERRPDFGNLVAL